METREGECCGRVREIRVHSSRIAPWSFAYCSECDQNGAEPADFIKAGVKYKDGEKYWGWGPCEAIGLTFFDGEHYRLASEIMW